MPKVIVGMSGGVDSSIAAYLLKKHGLEVEGLSFQLWDPQVRADLKSCCSLQSIEDAAKTASAIGVPHRSLDARSDFIEKVIKPFAEGYTKGITPNPCILCNMHIKFPILLKEAEERGAEFIATGHYSWIERDDDGEVFLKKGTDTRKDQSYFLYGLKKPEMQRLILPLGNFKKEDTRKLATDLKLPAAQKAESQEICFIEERNYFEFINKIHPLANKPGDIIHIKGKKVMGKHNGICHYTIGQRKGLGVSSLEPLYVTKIDGLKNIVYVGPQEAAEIREFEVDDLNWLMQKPSGIFHATVKIRSMMKDEPATISPVKKQEKLRVKFDRLQWAPAPGQSAVFYHEDKIIGGGIIQPF
ncbi:MAG: tRNA 2-thiouridine(34) synthase MnmA [Nitrospiraceae bacterium]|nr:tRNA 2-thiouridine(34) synthase MnmA [Nitrospiraceae bacterium]